MSPGSSTESYPAFARIGLRENPGKNLNQVTCPDRDSNPGHLVSLPDALTVTPQKIKPYFYRVSKTYVYLICRLPYKIRHVGEMTLYCASIYYERIMTDLTSLEGATFDRVQASDLTPMQYSDPYPTISYPPYLEAVSSIRNLRTRHAVVIGTHNTWILEFIM
ncbi:hypothetical protein ANN_10445 [Periplaneta americana]|uniref:Uncharacterized protein n=1 Tax=Periplaneta americana TaxID=6978 RepID=A0ABQ8TS70_PERAM|nr:hypothetical protein ANN_10445 [Periplaneta americana]